MDGDTGETSTAQNTRASKNGDANGALMTLPESARYDVGYKKPPVETRFKKGQSGNPKGRPKGAKNKVPAMNEERLKSIVLEEAYRAIPVNDRGKNVSIPIAQAVVRSLAVNAAKGNTRAQRLFTEMLAGTETSRKREHDAMMEAAINFKIEWEREFERCDRLGIPRPEPLPHPDDVIIDMRKGTVRFAGPVTKEEKVEHELWVQRKADFVGELEYFTDELSKAETETDKELYRKEITQAEKVLEIIRRAVPD